MWQNYDEFYGYHWQCWTSFSLSALNVPCEWKYRYVCWIKNMLLMHKFVLSLPSSLYLFIWCKNYFGLSIFPYFLSINGSICLSLTATALIVATWVRTTRLQMNCGLAMRKQCPRAHYCPHDNAVGIFNVNHTPYHTFTDKHSSVCPLRTNRSWFFLMLIPVCLVEWSVFRRLFFLWVEKCKNCKNDHMKAPCMTQRSNRLHLNVRLLIRPIWLSRKSAWVCS